MVNDMFVSLSPTRRHSDLVVGADLRRDQGVGELVSEDEAVDGPRLFAEFFGAEFGVAIRLYFEGECGEPVGQGDRVVFRVIEGSGADAVDTPDEEWVREFEGFGERSRNFFGFTRREQFVAEGVFFGFRNLPSDSNFSAVRDAVLGGVRS